MSNSAFKGTASASVVLLCLGLILSACGATLQVRGAQFDLNGQEATLADQYMRGDPVQAPPEARCQYWAGRTADAVQGHAMGALIWPPQHFMTLGQWAQAKRMEACQAFSPRFTRSRRVDSAPVETGAQAQTPTGTSSRPCELNITARVEGNTVVTKVDCGGQPLQGARIGLSVPMTHPDAHDMFKQTQLAETTNSTGEVRFDLSSVQADSYYIGAESHTYFNGEFDSGTKWTEYHDYQCPLAREQVACTTRVELKDCPLFPTWKAQAVAAQQAERDEAARKRGEVDTKRREVDGQCSAGNGASCYSAATAMCRGSREAPDPRFRLPRIWTCTHLGQEPEALAYYHKACALHHPNACDDEASLREYIQKDQEDAARFQAQPQPGTATPNVTRQINASNPLQYPVSVMPGQTVSASFTTTQDNARLSCDFRTFGQTNQTMFDHSNGRGRSTPCTVSITNRGVLGVNVVLVVATNYDGHPITINGNVQ